VIRDCIFDSNGTNAFKNEQYGIYIKGGSNQSIENNLITDINPRTAPSTYSDGYGIYRDGNDGTACKIVRNEITRICSLANLGYTHIWGIYLLNAPDDSKVNNNLLHHFSPACGSFYRPSVMGIHVWLLGPSYFVECKNNVVDRITTSIGDDSFANQYGIYLGDSGSMTVQSRNNIVTNCSGRPAHVWFGITHYDDGTDFSDVWMIDDKRFGGAAGGPNCINSDPNFVNGIIPMYDYHLQPYSPCKGAGEDGADMGCYGNLPGSITKVGLLTP